MDFLAGLETTYLALEIGWFTTTDCIDWAEHALSQRPDDPDLILLYGCARAQKTEVHHLVNKLLRIHCPNFDATSSNGRLAGLRVVKQMCEAYIRKDITPDELCQYAEPLEVLCGYPDWAFDLFNVCDRDNNEPRTRDSPDHIERVCAQILALP